MPRSPLLRSAPEKPGTLTIFCGKMGAGKSTTAKKMAGESSAVLLSEDEWLASLYPGQMKSFDDYLHHAALLKSVVKPLVQNILSVGSDVIMDFPANTVGQRRWFLELSSEVGAEHVLVYLEVSDERCLQQIGQRRIEQPERAALDTEQTFYQVTRFFEPPDPSEGLNLVRPKG